MGLRAFSYLAFLFKDLKISTLRAHIFLLCDKNKFSDGFFSWKAYANLKDEFRGEITKIKNKIRLKNIISSTCKFMRHC
jgi:hypothetical protein